MFYITGDTHGDFTRALRLCKDHSLRKTRDVLIVLGDAGINYYGDSRDMALKMALSRLSLTIFCIHGNHEMRPQTISSYREETWHGGKVNVEPDYPNLLFAEDGEIFDLDGVRAIVIGGAYSVDK